MGLFDIFKKSADKPAAEQIKPEPESVAKKEAKPKKSRKPKVEKKIKAEPEVKFVNFNFDPTNPRLGSIELDWNKEFVDMLKQHGYMADTDEDIVDAWLMDVCKNIAQVDFPEAADNVRYIQRRDLGGGKTEFS